MKSRQVMTMTKNWLLSQGFTQKKSKKTESIYLRKLDFGTIRLSDHLPKEECRRMINIIFPVNGDKTYSIFYNGNLISVHSLKEVKCFITCFGAMFNSLKNIKYTQKQLVIEQQRNKELSESLKQKDADIQRLKNNISEIISNYTVNK